MATNYPGSLDSLPRPTSTTAMDASGFEGDVVIDNISDAIEAIEAELGTDPAGSYATVKARLDAAGWAGVLGDDGPVSGRLYAMGGVETGSAVGGALDYMRVVVFYVPESWSIDQLSCNVTTADSGAVCRMGIYAWANGQPGSLVVDAGTVDASSTGQKDSAISTTLTPGWYAVGVIKSTTAVQLRAYSAPLPNIGYSSSSIVTTVSGAGFQWQDTGGSTGGLASTGGTATVMPSGGNHVVAIRTA